jgi:hypothetical protein
MSTGDGISQIFEAFIYKYSNDYCGPRSLRVERPYGSRKLSRDDEGGESREKRKLISMMQAENLRYAVARKLIV